ncbi:MAG TPA: PHB depolymerase family esterase [Gemmatimonadaceae bacterium]|nr:PHB depolymerase family esterase [Gemmatimonadaceae bacterium]
MNFSSESDRPRSPARILSRRDAVGQMLLGAIAVATPSCLRSAESAGVADDGRIAARPHEPSETIAPGRYPLKLGKARDGLLYVPKNYQPTVAAPLAVLLHGAGQSSDELLDRMITMADDTGMVLAAPDSREASWDIRYGAFGPDIVFINDMLELVFKKVRVDGKRVRVCGFSDGASYALSIGLLNGDLFGKIVAMSPGYLAGNKPVGKPSIFITHGTRDQVLSIDRTSRLIVPRLRAAGYEVDYHEFDGPHTIPLALLRDATTWMAAQ